MLEVDGNLFVHFPKTGGTYIRNVLSNNSKRVVKNNYHRSHAPISEIDLTQYNFTFGCVRNPIEWYESAWKHLIYFHKHSKWGKEEWNPLVDLSNVFSKNFNTFIEGCLKEYPSHYTKMLKLYHGNKFNALTFVLKTETLSYDLVRAVKIMGLDVDPKKIIMSPLHGKRDAVKDKALLWKDYNKKAIIENEYEVLEKFYI